MQNCGTGSFPLDGSMSLGSADTSPTQQGHVQQQQQQQIGSSVSSPLTPESAQIDSVNVSGIGTSNTTNNITETLQTQVQIRDITHP
jgi:hypothetical protein